MQFVSIEDHYIDEDVARWLGIPLTNPVIAKMLLSNSSRIEDMDAAGISHQVISHLPPGLQAVASSDAVVLCSDANDRLADYISVDARLHAFAAIATSTPGSMASELERCVTRHNFRGAMIHGSTNGVYSDNTKFWDLFACAEELDVPVYIHPSYLDGKAAEYLIGDLGKRYPNFGGAAWGFTVDAATHAIRLVLGGVFDRFPNLKIVLGHLGEGLPFLLDRTSEALGRDNPELSFRDVFREKFFVTTSGFFSTSALMHTLSVLDPSKVMLSVDWPFASSTVAVDWLKSVPLDADRKAAIAGGNAIALLRINT